MSYEQLFIVERPFPDEGLDGEIHTPRNRFLASGCNEERLRFLGTTTQERARFMLCKSLSDHRFDYLYDAMIKAD